MASPSEPGTALPPVPAGDEPWSAAEVTAVAEELRGEVGSLQAQIDAAQEAWEALHRDAGEGAGDDQADTGTKTFEREHELSLAANSRELLAQTQRAIERLAAGTYGVCEACGLPIRKARLQAFPRATLCVSCKAREERR